MPSQPTVPGRNIAKYRKVAKISAEDLAERAGEGLTRSIVANLENGRKSDLSVRQLLAIAGVLRVSPLVLLTDLERPGDQAWFQPEFKIPLNSREYDPYTPPDLEPSQLREDDLARWISGSPLPADVANEATDLSESLLRAIGTYSGTFQSFTHSVERLVQLREGLKGKSGEQPVSEHDEYMELLAVGDVQNAARTLISAVEQARALGIEIQNTDALVNRIMARLDISLSTPSARDDNSMWSSDW